jgi:hypothetical protein
MQETTGPRKRVARVTHISTGCGARLEEVILWTSVWPPRDLANFVLTWMRTLS